MLSHPSTNLSIRGLAIIDDQASITIADPQIISSLQVRPSDISPTMLSTTTVQGTSPPEACQLIHGLVVTPLKGTSQIKLPSTYVHKALPNVLKEVPSQENVKSTPGLEHLAQYFPKKEDWPTILLIGRDCAVAQRQEHFTLSSNKQQIQWRTLQKKLVWRNFAIGMAKI